MKTKSFRIGLLALALLSCGLRSPAQEIHTYLSIDDMPDLVACLPPPPDTTGVDFAYDISRYLWGKAQRSDPARAEIAIRDAIWSIDTVIT